MEQLAPRLPGEGAAGRAAGFAARAPAGYRERTSPAEAALDLAEIAALVAGAAGHPGALPAEAAFGGPHRLALRPSSDSGCSFRIRRFGLHGVELTQLLPVLESFGLVVVESVPHKILPGADGEPAVHVDDIGIRTGAHDRPEARFVPEVHGRRLIDAMEALARGATEVDPLNELVTVAGLDWRQVTVLRAYLRYRLQTATTLTADILAGALLAFPDLARSLVGYFEARFDPSALREQEAAERARCVAQLDLVPTLEQDRALRGYLELIDATWRTNFFQVGPGGEHRPNVVLKLDSAAAPDLPAPRPLTETFVHGPTVEAIHLRAGRIARGGIRWSDRPDDFRTEILDLAFAQVKKNAIIVPTGAKGGFVCRAPGRAHTPAGASPEEVRAAYEALIRGLLDITDNIAGGAVVAPDAVVARDAADPYLVVAADKGTATFSDLANTISEERGFWLGDAFASGGSHGYDHKKMGITARGAWVAVRRHFHQLGIDVQSDPVRVAGVGDMSGDVFGNAMLQSSSILLVAAFDHRHVFIDPSPGPDASYAERRRLAGLPRSSWDDYRRETISAGGGVWPRDAKVIPLSPEARAALGIESASMSPPELISAILAAPVDLLWFGGIGTYVKAPEESDAEVGDHTNDALRVTADRVRARVIAEGANLGVTQRARIRYSRRGGRINADFVDNAAGVSTSDREVNLKILLALAVEEGRLAADDRDGYLERSADEVATGVLRQVDHTVAALGRAVPASAREIDAYEALIEILVKSGQLDRAVESLPAREEIAVRRAAGAGLIRPELAVLLAYAKSDLAASIEGSDLVRAPALLDAVMPYFPLPIRQDFGEVIPRHRLYPQLVATEAAAEIVDQLGVVWAHETAAELGVGLAEVAGAFWAAREVLGAGRLWAELEQLSPGLPADAEAALHATVDDAVVRLARCYLARPEVFDVGSTIERDGPLAAAIAAGAGEAVKAEEEEALVDLGADRETARRFVSASAGAVVGDAGPVATASGRDLAVAVEALALVDRAAGLDRLVAAVGRLLAGPPYLRRLTAWQARALLDDTGSWRRQAAVEVLARGEEPGSATSAWEAAHQGELARASRLLEALHDPAGDPLAVATLVLRRLHATR